MMIVSSYFSGKDSTCNPKDPCLVSPTVSVREVICHGDTAYVWVETSVLGVATRLIELQVGDDSRSCSGTKVCLMCITA